MGSTVGYNVFFNKFGAIGFNPAAHQTERDQGSPRSWWVTRDSEAMVNWLHNRGKRGALLAGVVLYRHDVIEHNGRVFFYMADHHYPHRNPQSLPYHRI